MKNVLFLVSLLFSLSTSAQIVTKDDFDRCDKSYLVMDGDAVDIVESALKLKSIYELDKNNAITRTTIVDSVGKTKSQIYVEANNWFVHSFNDGESVIQLNDKDAGVIIAKGFIKNVTQHVSFTSSANVHAWVIIRVDIKDDRFRITTTIQEYILDMGTGALGAMNGDTSTRRVTWLPVDCFPYNGNKYKKTTSKAFVNCCIWSDIVANKMVEAVTNGITGTESEW